MNLRPLAVATLVTAAVMALAPSASAEDHWQARPESNHHAAHASHVVGDSADWTWLGGTADLTPRWDPCATITWSYPAGASPMVQRVTDHSFMLLARFTGYSFQRVDQGGAITITIHSDGDPYLTGAVGVTYPQAVDGPGGVPWLSSVQVGILDRAAQRVNAYTPVLMHELGHAVGLGHAADYREVMASGGGATVYGAGDRASPVSRTRHR
jgi:hypothetical protein